MPSAWPPSKPSKAATCIPHSRAAVSPSSTFGEFPLVLTASARRYLAQQSAASGSGARYVARSIARHVTTPLSSAILSGGIAAGQTAHVDFDGSAITVRAA